MHVDRAGELCPYLQFLEGLSTLTHYLAGAALLTTPAAQTQDATASS